MRRGNASRFPDKRISTAAALGQMKTMLASARSIDHLTPELLARMYRCDVKTCEYELTIQKQRRANVGA